MAGMSQAADTEMTESGLDPALLEKLSRGLEKRKGIDLLSYKPRVLERRINTRLRARECEGLDDYLELLAADPGEWDDLFKALIINVSGFFRNMETFEAIAKDVVPEIVARKKKAGLSGFFAVSAGCANGEEPYSLAMLLKDRLGPAIGGMNTRVLGLDIDKDSVERARRGNYDSGKMEAVPRDLKEKFFEPAPKGRYTIGEEIREMVEFRVHDLRNGVDLEDVDLLICRNLLIYFRRERQAAMLRSFLEALNRDGYLVLGKTETMVAELRPRVCVHNLSEHVYRKVGVEPCGWR